MCAIVELADMGIPISISGMGEITLAWGEEGEGSHVHLGRFNEQGYSIPLTAESLAKEILGLRSTAVSPWRPMTEADLDEIKKDCWLAAPGGGSWCGLPKGHAGKHAWELPPVELELPMAREFDCGDGVRLVRNYDGLVERKGWFFSHWSWQPMPAAVQALWPLPAWPTAEAAYAALVEWRRGQGPA